jgi:hypothetical protein
MFRDERNRDRKETTLRAVRCYAKIAWAIVLTALSRLGLGPYTNARFRHGGSPMARPKRGSPWNYPINRLAQGSVLAHQRNRAALENCDLFEYHFRL